MRIAILSPMISPLAQPYAGGTEAITAQLARGLATRGHRVTLLATAGSDDIPGVDLVSLGVKAREIAWPAAPRDLDGQIFRGLLVREQEIFHHILLHLRGQHGQFDLLHNNSFSGWPIALADMLPFPMLTTLHCPPILLEQNAALRARAAASLPNLTIAVSHGLAREFAHIVPITAVVHNGVEVPSTPEQTPQRYLLFVGRIAPEKGADLAIAAARAAGVPLLLAGRIEDQAYYEREVAPHLDGTPGYPRTDVGYPVRYLGHLDQEALWDVMGRARALLFTPRWPEPCSLAVLEGLARGVPAIAFALGGLPEQIVDGRTGFLVPPGDVDAVADAIRRLNTISSAACRTHASRHFSVAAMISAYEVQYAAAIASRRW